MAEMDHGQGAIARVTTTAAIIGATARPRGRCTAMLATRVQAWGQ